MKSEALEALRYLVNTARNQHIQRLAVLRYMAHEAGYSRNAVNEALEVWANYAGGKAA